MRISDWSSDVCSSDLEGRMAGDVAELHFGHHRQPQRRGLSSSRGLSECHRQRHYLRAATVLRLSLDIADVPLQRLDLYLGGDRGSDAPSLPVPGGLCAQLSTDRLAQGEIGTKACRERGG